MIVMLWFRSMGGVRFWTLYLGSIAISKCVVPLTDRRRLNFRLSILFTLQTWFLGYWTKQYEGDEPVSDVK